MSLICFAYNPLAESRAIQKLPHRRSSGIDIVHPQNPVTANFVIVINNIRNYLNRVVLYSEQDANNALSREREHPMNRRTTRSRPAEFGFVLSGHPAQVRSAETKLHHDRSRNGFVFSNPQTQRDVMTQHPPQTHGAGIATAMHCDFPVIGVAGAVLADGQTLPARVVSEYTGPERPGFGFVLSGASCQSPARVRSAETKLRRHHPRNGSVFSNPQLNPAP